MCGRRLGEEGGARGRKQLRQPRVWERLSPRGSGTEARLRGWGLCAPVREPLWVCAHMPSAGRQGGRGQASALLRATVCPPRSGTRLRARLVLGSVCAQKPCI